MKPINGLLILCLWVGGPVACAGAPNSGRPVPPATETSAPQPTVAMLQTPTDKPPGAEEIGDMSFVPYRLTVESAAVAAADFNGDGHLDLVSAGEPQLTIFLGDGAGGLSRYSRAPGGEHPVDFALADLDQDRDIDIVVANHDTDYVTILLGDGHGTFQPAPDSPLRVDVNPHPHAVQLADFDGDGHLDLAVDHREAEGVLILKGLGSGRFESPGTLVAVGGDPYRGMAVGDLNGDGKPDLVTPNPDEVGVLLNTSDALISFAAASSVAADAPFAVQLGDFNGDGHLDVVAASDEGSALVELFLGDGQGGFEEAGDSPFNLAPGAKKIAMGDFNGDGFEDAAVSSYQSPEVLILLGGSDTIRASTLPSGEHPWGLAAADFNEDGRDDLVVADDSNRSALVYLSIMP